MEILCNNDVDLQPPEVIPEMQKIKDDKIDVVYAVRRKRDEKHLLKNYSYIGYKLINKLSDIDIPKNGRF